MSVSIPKPVTRRRPRVFCDLHGVLVDFVTPACSAMGVFPDPEKLREWDWFTAYKITEREFWSMIEAAGQPFWATLPDYPWTRELLVLLHDLDSDWSILTAPGARACEGPSVTGTRELVGPLRRSWRPPEAVIHANDKHRVCGPGDILIDDSERNVAAWSKAGGRAVLWPQWWNRASGTRGDDLEFGRWRHELRESLREHIHDAMNDGA